MALPKPPRPEGIRNEVKPNIIPDGPKNMLQREATVRRVIACAHGTWSKFENLLKARTIFLPENHHMIYSDPADLIRRCPSKYLVPFKKDFGLETPEEIFEHIWNTAKDPYKTVEDFREGEAAGVKFKQPKTRTKRKLSYRIVFDRENERQAALYWALCPQARSLIDIIDEEALRLQDDDGKHVVFTEQELYELIHREAERLETRQSPWRIFQYYRGKLIQYNFLRYAK